MSFRRASKKHKRSSAKLYSRYSTVFTPPQKCRNAQATAVHFLMQMEKHKCIPKSWLWLCESKKRMKAIFNDRLQSNSRHKLSKSRVKQNWLRSTSRRFHSTNHRNPLHLRKQLWPRRPHKQPRLERCQKSRTNWKKFYLTPIPAHQCQADQGQMEQNKANQGKAR